MGLPSVGKRCLSLLWVFSKQPPPWGGDPSFGLRHNVNYVILEKEKIAVWSVTVQDIYLGRNLVRLGDFKIRHKAFSQDLVYLTFTLVFHSCHYSRFTQIKLSVAPLYLEMQVGADFRRHPYWLSQVAHSRPPT